jgi:TolA-binding protein
MSRPAETSQQPNPAPQPQHTGFDPVEFWFLHKLKIIALASLFVVGIVGYTVYDLAEKSARESASRAFAAAKTVDDYKKVIAEHSGQPAAGNAQLMLAELLRKDGKLDEANTILRAFIEQHPTHPMLAGGWLAIAQNAESAGKSDEALTNYQKILTTFPTSYAAPIALLSQARIQKAKGQNDLAKRSYEQVLSQYQNTFFSFEAQRELGTLNKAK